MPQKHDVGHQKRKKAATRIIGTPPPRPGKLAIDLVRRGLASPMILDGMSGRFTGGKD
jgi:hypothetical protein